MMQIIKQANGLYRWTATSSNNIEDRDGETLSLKALQADVARTKMFGDDDGVLNFYHIPYPIGGAPDYRTLVDGMLVETGEFYDEPVAKAVAEYCIANPDGLDGSGWGTSVGFMGVPDYSGVYNSVLIRERSLLPLSKAANAYTSFGVKQKMAITPDQQKALDLVLNDPTLIGVVMTSVDAQNKSKMADGEGVVRKAKKVADPNAPVEQPVFKKAGNYTATPQDVSGFGQGSTKAAGDGTPVQAVAEAILDVAEQAVSDVMDVVAAGTAAPEDTGMAPAAPVTMAADAATTAAPATTPAPANTEAPAPDTSATPQKAGMSDDDMAGIAKWVTETVNKAVGDAMAAYDQKMQASMAKMSKTFAVETQVKMLNEVPRTTYERLKAFGAQGASGFVKDDPEFVEKGKNLPPEPSPQLELMTKLGFAGLE